MGVVEILGRIEIFKGKVVNLTVESVRLPNDHVTDLEIIRHAGAAAVVPVDKDGRVLMVRQYRHATGDYLLEIPAGKLDEGEEPAECACRELEEETGYTPAALTAIGWIWTTPGFTDEKIWLFIATGLTPTEQALEDDEVLSVEAIPLENAIEMAMRDEIQDAKTICGLMRAAHQF
jgi:ADP-ribose pyrophosphatase